MDDSFRPVQRVHTKTAPQNKRPPITMPAVSPYWKTTTVRSSRSTQAYTILEHFCAATEELELVQDGMMVWANANNRILSGGIMGYSSQSDFSSLSAQSRQWNLKGMIGYQESHDEERTVYKAKTYGVDGVKNSTHRFRWKSRYECGGFCLPYPDRKWSGSLVKWAMIIPSTTTVA